MGTKERDEDVDPLWEEVKQLFRRVPLASSAAFLMCFVGIIVFSGCLFAATDYLVKFFDIKIVGQMVWLWMFLHIIAACVFLLLATLATGDTRREVCQNRCQHCNIFGKLAQISAMGSAYFLHFIWLLLICLLLLPVGMLTGINVVCPMIPDCVNLSHYGIPSEYVSMIKPDEWIVKMDSINSTDLIRYINQTENIIQDAIVTIEDSPMLDELLQKIEDNIPSDEEVQKFLDMLLKYVDAEPIVALLSKVQGEVRKVDTDEVIDDVMVVVNDTLEELDKITDALEVAVDEFSEEREKAFDALEKGINDTLGDGNDDDDRRRRRRSINVLQLENDLSGKFEHVKDSLVIAGGNVIKAVSDLYTAKYIVHANLSQAYAEMDEVMAHKLSEIRARSTDAVYKILHTPAMSPRAHAAASRQRRQAEDGGAVQEGADKVVDAVEDGLEAANQGLDNLDEELDKGIEKVEDGLEEVEKALETAEEKVDEVVEKVTEEAEKLAKQAEELAKQAGEEVQKLAKEAQELAAKGLKEGKRVAELTKEEIKKLVEDAKLMAENADVAARIAAAEAELAVKRAEEATKYALANVDEEAARLAREAEEFARKAAKQAQLAADRALERAKEAAQEAEKLVKAAAEGATEVLLDAARNIRYYAKVAIQAAKYATREAGKGARKVAVYYDIAKVEIKIVYAEAKIWWSEKLAIEKKEEDTFCLGAKSKFCKEIDSAHYNMIFVFIASIVINKSMVHFLMAMSANWVHLRRAEKEQDKIEEETEMAQGANEKLVYSMNDEGSVQMV